MKKLLLIFLLSMSGVSFAHAGELPISNAGFVQSNIWYSKDPFYAGDSVRIYTVIFNGSIYDLMGAVEFLDNGVVINKTKFSISHGGRAQDLWVDWKAGEGRHTIAAHLVDVVADGPNGRQSVMLPNGETGTNERVVEIDPAIKEARAKLDAQKVVDTGTHTIGKVSDTIQSVNNVIPAPIKDAVSVGANIVERFRLSEGYQLRLAKEQKSRDIDAIVVRARIADAHVGSTKKEVAALGTVSNATEKPFAYVLLVAISALQFIFEWRVMFYGIILYVLYHLIKLVVYKIRGR